MDKKREEVYIGGLICLVLCFFFSLFAVNSTILTSWNIASIGFWFFAIVSGVFGVGSFLKPDSFGVIVLSLLAALGESQEKGSSSHSQQTQKRSNGSVQVNTGDEAEVHVSVSPKEKERAQKFSTEEVSQNAKVFGCPNGHRVVVFQPDDNHPKASLEEDYAKKYALGTVISRKYTCRNCGSEFTLYWYQERIGFVF
jgi:hypothetical protein